MSSPVQSEARGLQTPEAAGQLSALLHGAGTSPLDSMGWIRVTGEDRVRWLNGMVTNSIQDLQPGKGCYNFLLSVQGRIQGDGYIFAEPDALLLETAREQISGLMALLDRFIIMDDVELADLSDTSTGLSISGPKAASILDRIGISVASPGELERKVVTWNSAEIVVIHGYSPLVPHFEIWAEEITSEALAGALLAAGAIPCGQQAQEWLRLLEGTPQYGTDIRDRELPQETGQTRALHFAKGCYLGQEIVERIRSRGNVHRAFTAFRLEGTVPSSGTTLETEGKQVGELTSAAAIPISTEHGDLLRIGLGYVRREALERNLELQYSGGTAVPVSRPFTAIEALGPNPASESSERV